MQQFMVLQDAKGVVCTLWGGYSPKVFDGDFFKVNQDWIEQSLAGDPVLADNHFEWAKKHLQIHHNYQVSLRQLIDWHGAGNSDQG